MRGDRSDPALHPARKTATHRLGRWARCRPEGRQGRRCALKRRRLSSRGPGHPWACRFRLSHQQTRHLRCTHEGDGAHRSRNRYLPKHCLSSSRYADARRDGCHAPPRRKLAIRALATRRGRVCADSINGRLATCPAFERSVRRGETPGRMTTDFGQGRHMADRRDDHALRPVPHRCRQGRATRPTIAQLLELGRGIC